MENLTNRSMCEDTARLLVRGYGLVGFLSGVRSNVVIRYPIFHEVDGGVRKEKSKDEKAYAKTQRDFRCRCISLYTLFELSV